MVTELYEGQGLGNQLWLYAVCRTLAEETGRAFGIQSHERFKGRAFLELDFGVPVIGNAHHGPSPDLPQGVDTYIREAKSFHPVSGADVTTFDERLMHVKGSVKIDGNFESESYILARRDQITKWFTSRFTVPLEEDVCVISFRGGEYAGVRDLFLPRSYYENAVAIMREREPRTKFLVVTDDSDLARRYFPDFPIVSNRKWGRAAGPGAWLWSRGVGRDFALVQGARTAILSNSSFSWWGTWTNPRLECAIAPKYWARHNVSDGYWSAGDSLTQGWDWLDREGTLWTYEECLRELEEVRAVQRSHGDGRMGRSLWTSPDLRRPDGADRGEA